LKLTNSLLFYYLSCPVTLTLKQKVSGEIYTDNNLYFRFSKQNLMKKICLIPEVSILIVYSGKLPIVVNLEPSLLWVTSWNVSTDL
jgi:hypothetical protein